MQPIEITQFLGLRNTVSEARQPLGALTHADNILIDDSGAIIRRKGCIKVADGKISSSYGTRDHSAIYLVDHGDLYRFDGESFTLICADIGGGVCHWTEESASLIFVQSERRFIAIQNGVHVIDLDVPMVTDLSVMSGAGRLPEMSMGLCAQYVNKATGLRGALCPHQIVDVSLATSLLITVRPVTGYFVAIYGFMPDSGAWSILGETENFLVIANYPDTHVPADDLYFDVSSIPRDVVAMTYHQGRIAVATLTENKTTLIRFSVPNFYHLFDTISESFEFPDLITGLASVNGQLLITGMRSIHVFADGSLQKISDFGTPVGKPITFKPDGSVLVWTMRGVCKFPEFQNLTEHDFSVPAGFGCSTSLYQHDGSNYLITAVDDLGSAFNASFEI